MFYILQDKTICLTRGDVATLEVSANLQDGQAYTFSKGAIVRFSVFKKRNFSHLEILKDVVVTEETEIVPIHLTKEDTKIGPIINRPVDYWYEIVLNPDTDPQTIVGYDDADATGEKIFRLLPEGGDSE